MTRRTARSISSSTLLALGAALTVGLAGTAQAAPLVAAPASSPAATAMPGTTAAQTAVTSTLSRNQTLPSGAALVSPSGRYSVVLLADGSLVYRDRPNRLNPQGTEAVIFDVPGRDTAGAEFRLQGDGTLVLLLRDGSALDPLSSAGEQLTVQDDGNVVLYAAGDRSVRCKVRTAASRSSGWGSWVTPTPR